MAIVIEENKDRSALLAIVGWVVVVAALMVVAYIIFFKRPDIVEFSTPPDFVNTKKISELRLDPASIVNNPQFQSRKEYVPAPIPGIIGKSNPFTPLK